MTMTVKPRPKAKDSGKRKEITKLRYGSDIHLEFAKLWTIKPPPKEDEVLVLLGDTVPLIYLEDYRTDDTARSLKKSFGSLCKLAQDYNRVYFMVGNHEFYNGCFCDGLEPYNRWFREHNLDPKFQAINNEVVELNDRWVAFCCTLWTDMNRDDPLTHEVVGHGMNDFRLIRQYHDSPLTFTTQLAYQEFQQSKQFLTEAYEKYKDRNIVVITHHAPSFHSCAREFVQDHHFNGGYYSNLDEFILDRPSIKWWIHGHTHHNVDYKIGECNVITNQRGYPPGGWVDPIRSQGFHDFSFEPYIPLV